MTRKTEVEQASAGKLQKANEELCDALEAYLRANEHDGIDPETGLGAREALKTHYEGLAKTLRAYNAPENWSSEDVPKVYLPRFAAFLVLGLVDDLVSGRVRPSVRDLFFSRGSVGESATRRRAKEAAVRYVKYSRAFPATAPDAVNRVSEAFGVSKHAVRKWVRDEPDDPELASRQPKNSPRYANLLRWHMEQNAELYRSSRHVKEKGKD